jgi:hypothetical protein
MVDSEFTTDNHSEIGIVNSLDPITVNTDNVVSINKTDLNLQPCLRLWTITMINTNTKAET